MFQGGEEVKTYFYPGTVDEATIVLVHAVLQAMNIDHGDLRGLPRTVNPCVTDGESVFVKVGEPSTPCQPNTESRAATQLHARGFPVARQLTDAPIAVRDASGELVELTLWEYIDSQPLPHDAASVESAARLLDEAHHLTNIEIEPFDLTAAHGRSMARFGAVPQNTATAQMCRIFDDTFHRITELLTVGGHAQVFVHGDARIANAMNRDGEIVLVDWESSALFCREWDIAKLTPPQLMGIGGRAWEPMFSESAALDGWLAARRVFEQTETLNRNLIVAILLFTTMAGMSFHAQNPEAIPHLIDGLNYLDSAAFLCDLDLWFD